MEASAKRVGASDGNIVAVVIDCYAADMTALTSLVPLVWNPPTTTWAAQSQNIGPGTPYDWPAGARYIRVKVRDSSTGTGAVNRVSAVVVKRTNLRYQELAGGTIHRGYRGENMATTFISTAADGSFDQYGEAYGPTTFALDSADPLIGMQCVKITRSAPTTAGGIYALPRYIPGHPGYIPVSPGEHIVGIAHKAASGAGHRLQVLVECYDKSLALLSTLTALDMTPGGSWSAGHVQVGGASALPWPANTTCVKLCVQDVSTNANAVTYIHDLIFATCRGVQELNPLVAGDGIAYDFTTGLAIDPDGTTITTAAGKVKVKDGSIGATQHADFTDSLPVPLNGFTENGVPIGVSGVTAPYWEGGMGGPYLNWPSGNTDIINVYLPLPQTAVTGQPISLVILALKPTSANHVYIAGAMYDVTQGLAIKSEAEQEVTDSIAAYTFTADRNLAGLAAGNLIYFTMRRGVSSGATALYVFAAELRWTAHR